VLYLILRNFKARTELASVLTNAILKSVPVLVLGNKTDSKFCVSEPNLREVLELTVTSGKESPNLTERGVELFMCSVVKNEGFQEGFKWLCKYL
jgi:GTP-binding protein SAR1